MQVTPESLQTDLQWITQILCAADFIAIDCEMTGLGMAHDRLDFLDSLQERYTKVRTSAEQFQLVQYGICAFKWESESKAYVATPLNAFIFPKASSGALGIQKTFVCQASSLEFLKSHSFDFNAWIEQGMAFYNVGESVHSLIHQLKVFHTSACRRKRSPAQGSTRRLQGTRFQSMKRTQSLLKLLCE